MRFPTALAVALVMAIAAAAPAARVATGVITGTLVAADTGRAVRRARVSLSGAGLTTGVATLSDDQGVFSFTGLAAGSYTLSASRTGFLTVKYGEKTPGYGRAGTPISLADGQRIERVMFAIPRAGVLTGVVLDDGGDPANGTSVRALRYVMLNGARTLALAGTGTADDRGVYRIAALPPGDYIVAVAPTLVPAERAALLQLNAAGVTNVALPDSDRFTGYVPVFFPGTTIFSSATTVTLGVSEERSGIDMQLQLVPMTRVAGAVLDPDGVGARVEVQLVARDGTPSAVGSSSWDMMAGPDGRFSFDAIPPGPYTLIARARKATSLTNDGSRTTASVSGESRWAMEHLTVGGAGVSDVVLTLQRGLSVSGSFVFDGPTPPSLSARMIVMFTPAGQLRGLADLAGMQSAPVTESGRFTATDLVPGRYRVTPTPIPAGWTLTSAMFGGRDALDFGLELKAGDALPPGVLTLSTRQSELTGTLLDRAGAPTAAYTVVVFAADRQYWTPDTRRIQAMRPLASGRFSFRNLPPGTYRLAAATDVEPGEWLDPEFLAELAAVATPVTIADGEKKTQDVRIK